MSTLSLFKKHLKLFTITFSCVFLSLTAIAQPSISTISPSIGPVGSNVIISGSGFSAIASDNVVYFGAVKATVTAATTISLTVTVPMCADFSAVTVTVNGLTAYSKKPFVVTHAGTYTINTQTFSPLRQFNSGKYVFGVVSADFDNDGKPDIASSNYSDATVTVFKNFSSPGFLNITATNTLKGDNNVSAISVADIDGDGKKDIIITEDVSLKVSVFKNTSSNGFISFADKVDFSTGVYAVNVKTADINNDGKPDIIVTNNHEETFSVFRNSTTNGIISFAPRIDFQAGSAAYGIAVQDLNNDGKTDVMITNQYSNTVSVFRNTSSGTAITFSAKQDYSTGAQPYGIAVGDLDKDGKADILTANLNSNDISILRNTSTGAAISFAAKQDKTIATSPNDIALGDIDGDGNIDIAISNSDVDIAVVKNSSVPGFIDLEDPVKYSTGGSSECVVVGDIDQDYKPDIIAGSYLYVSILRSTNNPVITSFEPTKAISGTPITIHGYNLITASNVTIGNTAPSSFVVKSDTTITAVLSFGATGNVEVTSSDGTGLLPGFVYIPPPTIASFTPISGPLNTTIHIKGKNFSSVKDSNIVFLGSVKGNVISATDSTIDATVPPGTLYKAVTVSCNKMTAYAQSPFITTFQGGGRQFTAADFENQGEFATDDFSVAMAVSDLNNDGKADVLSVNSFYNTLSILRNTTVNNKVAFAPKKDYNVKPIPRQVATADFNGDGLPDVVIDNWDMLNGKVSIYKNTSKGNNISLSDTISYVLRTNDDPNGIATGDLDADGKPDIVVVGHGTVSIVKNTSVLGNISFNEPIMLQGFAGLAKGVAIADFDGDGKPDIAVTDYALDIIYLYRNLSTQGNISFANWKNITTGFGPMDIATGDLNGDGLPEIAVVNYGNRSVSVFKNTSTKGAISFAKRINYAYKDYLQSAQPIKIAITDLDGDGKPDIATANSFSYSITLFRNISTTDSIFFEPNVHYAIHENYNVVGVAPADFNNDGRPDIAVLCSNAPSVTVLSNEIQHALATQPLIFSGNIYGNDIQLKWSVADNSTIKSFDVERSTDALSFENISNIENSNNNKDFSFTDSHTLSGLSYYRLKVTETSGNIYYSKVLPFNLNKTFKLLLYPNPVKSTLVIDGLNAFQKNYISVINADGHVLYNEVVTKSTTTLNLSQLPAGMYTIKVVSNKTVSTARFIKE